MLRHQLHNQVSAFGGTSGLITNRIITNYEYSALSTQFLFCVFFKLSYMCLITSPKELIISEFYVSDNIAVEITLNDIQNLWTFFIVIIWLYIIRKIIKTKSWYIEHLLIFLVVSVAMIFIILGYSLSSIFI